MLCNIIFLAVALIQQVSSAGIFSHHPQGQRPRALGTLLTLDANADVRTDSGGLLRKEVRFDVKETRAEADAILDKLASNGVKVFVYELPKSLNDDLLECYEKHEGMKLWDDFREEKGQNTADIWIHRILLQHPLRTLDPSEATIFYIPFYGFLSSYFSGIEAVSTAGPTASARAHCNGRGHSDRVTELASLLQKSHSFQELPESHVMTVSFWAVAKKTLDANSPPPSVVTGPLFSLLKKSLLLVYEPMFGSMERIDEYKNWPGPLITIPYVAKPRLSELQKAPATLPRDTSLFFQGTIHSAYSPHLTKRQYLAKAFEQFPGSHIVDTNKHHPEDDSYELGMLRSEYCLVLQGDTPTSARLFDSIAAGCVPLIAAEHISLPFSSFIDWSSFSMQSSPESLIAQPADLIEQMPEEEGEKALSTDDPPIELSRFTVSASLREVEAQNSELRRVLTTLPSKFQALQKNVHQIRMNFLYGLGTPDNFTPGTAVDNIIFAAADKLGLLESTIRETTVDVSG